MTWLPSEGKKRENAERAARGEMDLDVFGRKRAGQNSNSLEEEEQTWTNPDDPSDTKTVWRRVPPDDRRCPKIIKSALSPWRGNQCVQSVIHGGPVCVAHGGRLPNVKKAAQARLAMAALPAADRLIYMALRKPKMSDGDRLRALAMILDRAGVEGKATLEIEVKPWQEALKALMDRASGDPEDPEQTVQPGVIEGEVLEFDASESSWEPDQ